MVRIEGRHFDGWDAGGCTSFAWKYERRRKQQAKKVDEFIPESRHVAVIKHIALCNGNTRSEGRPGKQLGGIVDHVTIRGKLHMKVLVCPLA